MIDTSVEINALKQQCRKDKEQYEIKINEIENRYDSLIRKIYDIDLKTYFEFAITDNMYNEYTELLDEYIDMMELNYDAPNINEMETLIDCFKNKFSN